MRFKTAFVVRDMETIQNLSRFAGQMFYLRRGAAADPSHLRTYEKAAVVDQPAFAVKVTLEIGRAGFIGFDLSDKSQSQMKIFFRHRPRARIET